MIRLQFVRVFKTIFRIHHLCASCPAVLTFSLIACSTSLQSNVLFRKSILEYSRPRDPNYAGRCGFAMREKWIHLFLALFNSKDLDEAELTLRPNNDHYVVRLFALSFARHL